MRPSALKATGESSAGRCRPGRHGRTVRKKRRNPGACARLERRVNAQAPGFLRFFRTVRPRRLGRHQPALLSSVAFKADGLIQPFATNIFDTRTAHDHSTLYPVDRPTALNEPREQQRRRLASICRESRLNAGLSGVESRQKLFEGSDYGSIINGSYRERCV